MSEKFKSFLYFFDFIGTSPELYVFHNNRYKTIFSSILSIIIILFSSFFTIYSLIEFFKYESPIISYSKGNDKTTKREFFLKDSFLMFELFDSSSYNIINNSIAYFDSDYTIVYDNGTYEVGNIDIEKCELGKNIDIKYKDFIKDKSNFGRPLEDFYCFGSNNKNISLFYYPNIGYNLIGLHIIIKNNTEYNPENIQILIVSENNLIEHNNKNNPISNSFEYHSTPSFSSFQYTTIHYNFQYIKYESDDGFFFKNSKIFNGISFSDMNYFNTFKDDYEKNLKENNSSQIGIVEFSINRANYDSYQRTYQRLQSLLAEIMSVVSLLFEIGNQIVNFFCEKNMKKDIIKDLINKDKKNSESNKNFNVNKIITQNSEIFLGQNRKRYESSDKINKINKQEISVNNVNIKSDEISEKSNDNNNMFIENDKMKKVIENNKELKKINYFHILISYLCFKTKKTEIINLCDDIVTEDLCVERILKRLYNLERFYPDTSSNESKEEIKTYKNKIFESKKLNSIKNNL